MGSLIEDYALRYYLFVLTHIGTLSIIYFLRDGVLALVCFKMVYLLGDFLGKDTQNTQSSRSYNRKFCHLLPLMVSCLETPFTLAIFWIQYEYITSTVLGTIASFICLTYLLVPSIDAAHQLLHRPQKICQIICYINLWCLQFTTYPIQHLYLHHKKVGSPQDPVTAPKNYPIYKYYINVIYSSYKFNYRYSKKFFLFCILATISNTLTIAYLASREEGSWIGRTVFFIGVAYGTLFFMEAIQYIEHYGLVYRKDGEEKPVEEVSSWNSVENSLLSSHVFRFQRHSDHHMNAYKVYSTLDLNPKMPLFPFNFQEGAALCLNPGNWYKIMNPYVDRELYGTKLPEGHEQFTKMQKRLHKIIILVLFTVKVAYLLI